MNKKLIKSKTIYSYLHDPPAIIGSLILVFFISIALLAPIITPQNPYDLEAVGLENSLTPPIWMEGGKLPFILGTDDQGRDILSTMIYGLRTSLAVGFGVVFIAGALGISLGLLCGYYGGILDTLIMRLADTLYSFSTAMIALLVIGLMETRGVLIIILVICIAGWVRYARTMRGAVLQIKQEAYVLAAKSSGGGDLRILLKHILPNAIPPILIVAAVDLALYIMYESTLSFLGVGVPITEPSLGMMISIGKNYLYSGMWWLVLFPGAVLILLAVSINLFADWIRDELNPKIT